MGNLRVHEINIQQVNIEEMKSNDTFWGETTLEWSCGTAEVNFRFCSTQKAIRALEFMDFLMDDCGMVKGDGVIAYGIISNTLMNMLVSKNEATGIEDFIVKQVQDYFEECDWIYASSFEADTVKSQLKEYRKKKIPWAYVKTTELGNVGDEIILKTLENESGEHIIIAQDVYIMIGNRGEVYHIDANKFLSTYDGTNEPLDVFGQMLDYLPEIKVAKTGQYISLDEVAKICYANQKNTILAMPLEKRTKVYYGSSEEEYFVGRKDDYLVIRKDDLHDVYIIKNSIFEQTYEEV